ncbi:MAG: phosphoribosylformylglycinamidine synthase [Deltaproteobacteria bacterium]|nr:phosphoribosylformylglycinamidine synthase [Deltaproteobacteria bacterium]
MMRLYRKPALSGTRKSDLLRVVRKAVSAGIRGIETESCFNIATSAPLDDSEIRTLRWLLAETFEPRNCSSSSFFDGGPVLEVGPRMNFTTAWSTNAVSVCRACGLDKIVRIERSKRFRIAADSGLGDDSIGRFAAQVHDRMTECVYPEPLTTFETGVRPEPVRTVPLLEEGISALREVNASMGLGLDDWDIEYYYNLFARDLKRNPTNVECFDLSQSNSEHSRHWFFRGKLVVDGREIPETLMRIVKQPLQANPANSVIAFRDNSSAIRGFRIRTILPEAPGRFSRMKEAGATYHLIFTAETHNFPSGVAPFPGAETGTGGRIRDVQATGKGGLVIAGTAAYCVGNLRIPGYPLPWEDASYRYPENLADPLRIEIEASNGASDYGNKFGEPVIQGFTRSFGMTLPGGERREWIKPIMFTGGIGQMDARHVEKDPPERGMLVTKIGGPAYRIGMGGGAASSMIQGENVADLDFNAVQRGDAEMEQKVNRVIRACVELGAQNPIVSIHDQGAGGNCNVVKEIVYPAGARIEVRKIQSGDATLSVLELWGAEYQEQNAFLIRPESADLFREMCRREKVPCAFIGRITGDGRIVLHDEDDGSTPVDLDLEKILGDMPQKTFRLERIAPELAPLDLPPDLSVRDALDRVLRLVSVGSKRFLTNKVDRSVTGLVARQQCAGPLQLTVSDVAVIGQSHFGLTGAAISIGEQPIKTLVDPAAMARLTVGEALTNLVWAKIGALEQVKCSGNWMWAAKLPGEGARLSDAAVALRDIMIALGIAIDGGKDSLSMAARVVSGGTSETVKSPGTLVVSAYAPCPDITKVVTPDIKRPGESRLLFIDLGNGRNRLGGSALAQVYGQVGDDCPDVDDPALLERAFDAVQWLVSKGLVLSGHDRSDGGLVTTLLEMAFSGNCGLDIRADGAAPLPFLFSEELGLAIEYLPADEPKIAARLRRGKVPFAVIGETTAAKRIRIRCGGRLVLDEDMRVLRAIWEETSHRLERLQVNPRCAAEEKESIFDRPGPRYRLAFTPSPTPAAAMKRKGKPSVAVVREEGSNSDREMASAFHQAGFEVWDATMTDFLDEKVDLDAFRGVAFVGGFSYADVLDSAKGWAGVIRFNATVYERFRRFYERPDIFSLGVCNGCQLMALLGWAPWRGIADRRQPRFIRNVSGRFESRFATVRIFRSPSIMLKGMEGSTLGIWVAHGEGRAFFPEKKILEDVESRKLAPVRYVDDRGRITMKYPFNPNGSAHGIAALCSPDGRHLAIMPHPERTFLEWQWGWMPEEWKGSLKASPWLRLFQNARAWCDKK